MRQVASKRCVRQVASKRCVRQVTSNVYGKPTAAGHTWSLTQSDSYNTFYIRVEEDSTHTVYTLYEYLRDREKENSTLYIYIHIHIYSNKHVPGDEQDAYLWRVIIELSCQSIQVATMLYVSECSRVRLSRNIRVCHRF